VHEDELVRLSEALDELAIHDQRLAEVVDLKYFCGLSLADIAGLRAVSERTLQRDWEKARLFLFRQLMDPNWSQDQAVDPS
jgi:DNA-directed RNA polymerase specialized sigma24 family protein